MQASFFWRLMAILRFIKPRVMNCALQIPEPGSCDATVCRPAGQFWMAGFPIASNYSGGGFSSLSCIVLLVLGALLLGIETRGQGISGSGEPDVDSFREWMRETRGREAEGMALARRRALAMRRLMRSQPDRALAVAIDSESRKQLPLSIQSLIEEEVAGFGMVGTLFDCEHSVRAQAVRLGGKLYLHHPMSPAESLPESQRIPLRGIVLNGEIALAKSPLRVARSSELQINGTLWPDGEVCAGCRRPIGGLRQISGAVFDGRMIPLCREEHLPLIGLPVAYAGSTGGSSGTAPGPSPQWTKGAKRLLYIPTRYSNQSSPPTSKSTAESALNQVSQFFAAQSYQQTSVTFDVSDPVQVAQTASHYESVGLGQLYNDAVALARNVGWDADDYDFVFIRHAGGPGGAGVGLVGEKGAWVQTDSWSVLAHELGHNYGLSHANGWRPKTSVPFGPGETIEYADEFDLMGPNRGSFSTYEKSVLHWMPDANFLRVTNGGTYRLHAFDVGPLAGNQLYALSLRKDVRDYWLDYRGEFQSGSLAPFALNGLQMRWPQWSLSRGGSTLVDATPGSPRGFDDAPLLIGRTFSDPSAGIHVTTVNRSPTPGQWLDVAIHLADGASNSPPQASMTATSTNVATGVAVTFAVSATDPEGDALAYGWETSVAGNSAVLAVSSNAPALTYSFSAAGRYEVRCVVSDMKGGVAVASIVVEVGAVSDFAISGQVRGPDGSARAGVRVFSLVSSVSVSTMGYVTHSSYRSALTDNDGRYVLLNVTAGNHTVRVMPTIAETFAPASGNGVLNVAGDLAGIDFVATAKPSVAVRGVVRDGGQAISNVVVAFGGLSALSAVDGSFVVSNVPPDSYDPVVVGNTEFIAPGGPFYVDGSSVTNADLFRVLYPVKGKVPGNIGLVYVSNGEPGRSVIALPDFSGGFFGNWVYELRLPRGTWNLEAACSGFTMVPGGFTNPVEVVGTEAPYYAFQGVQPVTISNLDFAAISGTTYSIRGNVTTGGLPLSGALVTTGTGSSETDSIGNFAIGRLAPGSYSVSATLAGYTFVRDGFNNPVVVGPDASNVNFIATSTLTNALSITSHPQSRLVTISSNTVFSVVATGTPPLAYQWYFNGTTLITGATNTSLTLSSVQDAAAGTYRVEVSNGASSVSSSNATLTINHPPQVPSPVLERLAITGAKARLTDFLGTDSDGDAVTLVSVGPTSTHGGGVATNSGWVIYSPPAGYTNADSFTFVLSDGRGGISQGTAVVNVISNNVVPENFRAELLPDGTVRLAFDGIPGRSYSIEFTTDLENPNWQTLAVATADAFGIFAFIDSLPPGAPQRFYRASWP